MKKKNKKNKNSPDVSSDKLQGKLKRHQEKLAKEEQKKEKSRNALFRRRVREASEKKAPKTLRTKAYYRFSKEYPSAVTPDGFRENKPQKEKLSAGKKFIAVICCIAVFCLSFLAVETAIVISERDIPDTEDTEKTETAYRTAVHLTPDDFRSLSAESILTRLKSMNADTAVIEFKDEYGYVYFDINSFTGASADRKIPDAEKKLQELKKNGIKCIAYISCFRDTVAASSSLEGAGLKNTMGTYFIASDGSSWLDPFSESAVTYITDIIAKASAMDFDSILLDNICFPPAGASEPAYSGDSSSDEKKNAVLTDFIHKAEENAGKDKIIIMSLISGIYQVTDAPSEKYSGLLTGADCESFAIDLRTASQDSEITDDSDYFNYVEEMPEVFILDALSLAKTALKDDSVGKLWVIVDSTLTDIENYIEISGIHNIIYR